VLDRIDPGGTDLMLRERRGDQRRNLMTRITEANVSITARDDARTSSACGPRH